MYIEVDSTEPSPTNSPYLWCLSDAVVHENRKSLPQSIRMENIPFSAFKYNM